MYIEITSSHGSVHSDEAGHVVATNLAADFGPVPVYINWPEWYKAYPGEKLPASVDILDVGYITGDGTYVEPCEDWREDRADMRAEEAEPTNWWFNVVTGAVTERRGHKLCDELEVTADYGAYLSAKPDGVWELRVPKKGDIMFDTLGDVQEVGMDYFDDGPTDLGYRWCKPKAVKRWWFDPSQGEAECLVMCMSTKPDTNYVEVTADYAAYVRNKPEGDPKLREVKEGDEYWALGSGWTVCHYETETYSVDVPPYRWCKLKPPAKRWWFCIITLQAWQTIHAYSSDGDMLEVTADYAAYLSNKPEGEWELRVPNWSELMIPWRDEPNIAPCDFCDIGRDDRGYRWCKPRAAKSTAWDIYAVEIHDSYYCVIGLDPYSTTYLPSALGRVGFDGTQFAEQADLSIWIMGAVAYVDKHGAISGVYYDGCKPATPVRVRYIKATT